MDRRRLLPLAVMLLLMGAVALTRFSQDVRAVQVVGLSGGGFSIGVGFAFLVLGLAGRLKA